MLTRNLSLSIQDRAGQGTVLNYNPATDATLNFHAKGRSGLSLVDRFGNNPTIIPSYPKLDAASKYFSVSDNGGLDIGANDFTLCGWIKNEQTSKTGLFYMFGKMMGTPQAGSYGFYSYNNGLIHAYVKSSGTVVDITSNIDTSDQLPHFVLLDVNQTTKKVRLFVDGVQKGSDTSFTGTFPALANAYKFCIGTGQNAAGSAFSGQAVHSCSDIRVFHRILSSDDALRAFNRQTVSEPFAHYPLICSEGTYEYDVSGNGYHLTGAGLLKTDYKYSSFGSRHGLDCGYDLYDLRINPNYPNPTRIYVGKTIAGVSIVSPPLPTNYLFTNSADGSLTDYNLCNSLVEFAGSQFDRSNATIWSSLTRDALTFYDATSSATKKRWHSTELNLDVFMNWANDGYKRSIYPKITDTSAYDRKLLTEIFCSTADKSASDFTKIIKYTGDNAWYHTLDYSFTDIYICAQKGSKQLTFNNTTKVLSLSLDCGLTTYITKDLTGVCTLITDAYIYDNGNIQFANHTVIYLSTDNLSTYAPTTVLGIDGNTFTPTTYNNFRPVRTNEPTYYNGQEFRVLGNYSNDAGTRNDNINVWFTIDSGVTIKSIWKAGVTSPIKPARHIHSVSYTGNDKIMIETGDNANECNWIEGLYNGSTWAFTLIGSGDSTSPYKTLGMAQYDGRIIFGSDADGVISNAIWSFMYTDIADTSKWKKANYFNNRAAEKILGVHGNSDGEILASHMANPVVFTSINKGKYFIRTTLAGGPDLGAFGNYLNYLPKNTNGYFSAQIWDNLGETENNWTLSKNLLIKIVKTL